SILTYVGAAYIVWRAYYVARSKPGNKNEDKQPSFINGWVLQIVNVKIFLFGITALTVYVIPYYTSLGMLLFFEMIVAGMGTIATLSWVFFRGIFQNTYMKHYKVINIVLAALLLQSAFTLVI